MERRGVSHSAPYGHACMSCFKAKCRCVPRQSGDGCERCLRLKKPCTPSNSTRRRVHPDQKPNSDGRLTPFEDLVSLFQSRHNYKANAAAQQQQWAPSGFPSMEGIARLEALLDPFLELPTNTTNPSTPEPPDASTAACLETFRFHMLPHFPLIHFPAETTIQQLQHQRPFLFRAITCVASSTAREKRVRATELKHLLSEMVFGGNTENNTQRNPLGQTMDLLLGLLVYVAWGWDHQLSGRLMTVAMSLVDEVLPNKPTASDIHTLGLLRLEMGPTSRCMQGEPFLERERAVLACFVLSSAISTYSGQVDGLRWTPQMKQCLVAISSNRNERNDAVLALQVRLQVLTSQALQLRSRNHHTKYQAAAEALLSQLQDLYPTVLQHQGKPPQNSLTLPANTDHHLHTTGSLPAHFHHAELTILETLYANPLQSIPSTTSPPGSTITTRSPPTTTIPPTYYYPPPPPPTTTTTNPPASTIPIPSPPTTTPTPTTYYPPAPPQHPQPCKILLAIHSTTTTLLTLPDPSFAGIALPQWAQLTACLSALYRLEGDARWDAASVRHVADLPVVVGAVVERLEGVVLQGGGGGLCVGEGEGGVGGLVVGLRELRGRVLRGRGVVEREAGVVMQKGEEGERGWWLDRFWTTEVD
ncbi:hypothetical protein F5144DRAFT_594197 [Chaetomium tenue]|uniref:Uncharacterized protein n=1 Tax=Chaetomium tenue TaxID=1854479 RepID=A0ACB7P4H7_9PEZI|nr:hypothetical protein F5144DRAFT_594197 [Chaetomium globosum]